MRATARDPHRSPARPETAVGAARPTFDVERVRRDFPILEQRVRGKPIAYLDNAATTQKPKQVLAALDRYYVESNANVHRGVHTLSERATAAYEGARDRVRRFIGAGDKREIVFVRGATEGINLVAQSYGRSNASAGDEILITYLEHHSNIVPWQILCKQIGARLRVAPVNDRGELELDEFEGLIGPRTRVVAVNHVSNALGTINPVAEITEMAHRRGAVVLVDGAQAVQHLPVDVQEIGCDFYVFSGHKMYAPTGIGALYGKQDLLEKMVPYQGGGEMILSVTFERTTYNAVPHKFEAGTPDIAGAIGLGAAIDYLDAHGIEAIAAHERELLDYGTELLRQVPGLKLIGTAAHKASVLSFVLDKVHPHDIGTVLDQEAIAIRSGHHCAQPLMERFGVPATARASLGLYNTREELDRLAAALGRVNQMFG